MAANKFTFNINTKDPVIQLGFGTTFDETGREDLIKVYKDLSKRKYGFQFKTIPKGHNIFLNKLEEHIND